MTPSEEASQQESTKDLKSWWNKFTRSKQKEPAPLGPPAAIPGTIFGIPLTSSIKYANVAISLMQENGDSYTYGYIPIVVAKCGVFLKERATEVEGIFRLAGAARRTNQLQEIFNIPPTYGKSLDWSGYTVHDAANVLRRYLNQLPEPIVPLKLYEQFRDPLRQHQMQAVGNVEAKATDIGNFDYEGTIETYRNLITQLPPLNRQLLLYILDMLAIFAAKSNINHMTAANLAVIFQPGMLHHPSHDRTPHEYRLSQDVVIFLIDQQDNFLLGMPGTAADERTRQEVEAGPPAAQPGTPTRAAGVHRSVSTNSRSTNSSRLAGIRRNISVSSKGSRNSQHNVPGTPGTPGTPGVHRSNTLPSRRSPAIGQNRFTKPTESPGAAPEAQTPQATSIPAATGPVTVTSTTSAIPITPETFQDPEKRTESIAPSVGKTSTARDQSKERLLGEGDLQQVPPNRRGLANLLRPQASDDGQSRQPNKLRKKRQPSGAQPSGHSSAASLSADPDHMRSSVASPPREPLVGGDEQIPQIPPISGSPNGGFALTETAPTPRAETHADALSSKPKPEETIQQTSETATLKPKPEAITSDDPAESTADTTDASIGPDREGDKKEKKKRWRFSVSAKRSQEDKQQPNTSVYGSTSQLAGVSDADISKAGTSISERAHRRSSATQEKPSTNDLGIDNSGHQTSRETGGSEEGMSASDTIDKGKGPIGWFKQKLAERKEKDDAKERAKSPRRSEESGRFQSATNPGRAANGELANKQLSKDISETIPEIAEEEDKKSLDAIAGQPDKNTIPVSATTEAAAPNEASAKESVFQTSSLEDYMNDSDREKLATAREVQALLTKQEEEEKRNTVSIAGIASRAAANDTAPTAQEASGLVVDADHSAAAESSTSEADKTITNTTAAKAEDVSASVQHAAVEQESTT